MSGRNRSGAVRLEGTEVVRTESIATILGATIVPAAVPAVNDELSVDNRLYKLVRLVSADAGGAVFEFAVT